MLTLKRMTRELCHEYFMHFENDAAVFEDEKMCGQYQYSEDKVERYFQNQQQDHRIVLMIMQDNKPIGEIKIKEIDERKGSCFLGIHLQNDTVKGKGIGTLAEQMAIEYIWENVKVSVIFADVLRKNKRSIHVLEKNGFKFVKKDEKFCYYERRRVIE